MRPQFYDSPGSGYHDKARPISEEDLRVMEMPRSVWGAHRGWYPARSRVRTSLEDLVLTLPRKILDGTPSTVIFRGAPGSGKSSGAAILAKAARAHRFTAYWLDAGQLMERWRSREVTADGELTPRERAYDTEVLVLDGLGSGYAANEFVASETMALLRWRRDARRLTIVTTSETDARLIGAYGLDALHVLSANSVSLAMGVQPIAEGLE